MSVTAGAISLQSKSSNQIKVAVAAASGGVGPYTYQWYKSRTQGFSPGGGNIISGATDLSYTDNDVVPGTTYYYVNVATDTGDSNATDASEELGVTSDAPTLSQNQFAQEPYLGMLDLRFNANTVSVQIDTSQASPLYAGAAVKIVDSAGGIPKVVGCEADSDDVLGFINFNQKNPYFVAGDAAEISMAGNVIYLYSTAAIARGQRVVLDLTTNGGVAPISGSGGEDIVGWAFDKASAAGVLIRVMLMTPSFQKDA